MTTANTPFYVTRGATRHFPDNFALGAAAAAYQIEGAAFEDGRQASIWDTFARVPGAVLNGDNGDVACDHYHRYRDDAKLMAELGLDIYRFSISWARVMPDGKTLNPQGLDFYSRLVDELLANGINPWVTLYHWDLPQALENLDGWVNRDTSYRFRDYSMAVYNALQDRVPTWTTLNEPWCSSYLSYGAKEHAPGLGLGPGAFPAVHHLNLAHGLMTQAVRAEVGDKAKCSVTLNLQFNRGDADACHRLDLISNRAFLDPMLRGRYPDELFSITKGICDWDFIQSGDLELIHQPIDVLGINYYSTNRVAMSDRPQFPQSTEASTAPGASDVDWLPTEGPHTDMGWNIDPDGLHDLLVRVHDNYPEVDLVVTENGMACKDQLTVNEDGTKSVHDPDRIDYLKRHFAAAKRAIDEGVPLTGYFVWSLLDNFEWYFGYAKRFGITYVDYATQERIPKDSFMWYRDFLASRKG